jgi:serine protease inhibitor
MIPVAVALAAMAAGCGSPAGLKGATEVNADVPRAVASPGDGGVAAHALSGFTAVLLAHELGLGRGNVAFSPVSIATALAMVRDGARGTTASEIDRLLSSVPDGAMNALAQQLAARNGTFDTGKVEVDSANRVFAQQGLQVTGAFLDTLAREYGAGVGLVDFEHATEAARQDVNQWVATQTDGQIGMLIKPGVLSTFTRLVLVNAVYLDADWQVPFLKQETAPSAFHAPGGDVTVPFMHGGAATASATGPGWDAADLDYAGGQLAMAIVVPDAGAFDVVARQVPSILASLDAAPQRGGAVVVPKFSFATSMSLKQVLSSLGMPTAFTPEADFSGITTEVPLALSDVVHQADVRVDEKGTVAAAATGAVAIATAAPVVVLVADRPFLFVLHDRPTGAVLFAGQVTDPGASS